MVTRSKALNATKHPLPTYLATSHDVPNTATQALKNEKWREAMSKEFTALQQT
jgi:hypothetical protein